MSKTKTTVAAKSKSQAGASSFGVLATTLALALVVALEAGGVVALSQGPSQPAVVAGIDGVDGTAVAATEAPRLKHAASVQISIVAQADMPAN